MDAVSYSLAAKQAQRIEKFIENPDSASGIVTVPKIIPFGETITIPSGRVAVLPNLVVDGDLVLDGDIFIPAGESINFTNGIKVNGTNIALNIPTSYHLLSGNLSVDNTVLTNGFGLYLYTGNTTILPTINLGMDITSGDNGYLIKIKSRSAIGDWTWVNSVRGITKYISSNTTAAEGTDANMFTLSTVAGVTTLNIGTSTRTNTNGVTYEIEVYQTTHKKTGVTNQGKAFTEHYNPDTGFTIEGYEGSGLGLHEIPHSLGRKLDITIVKNLSATSDWSTYYGDDSKSLFLNLTNLSASTTGTWDSTDKKIVAIPYVNTATNQYIMFGWRNSYFDESGKLIGNFEIGVYQGTANATGLNEIIVKGKLASLTTKRLDSTSSWSNLDNKRNNISGTNDGVVWCNLTSAEVTNLDLVTFNSKSFTLNNNSLETNASGGQYLYFGVYDNDNGSGKSKYPKATDTANVQINNGIIPLAHGIDSNGSKNSIVVANETITGVTYTEGKNYLYKTDTGYGVKAYEPRYLASELVRRFAGEQPDYYDIESNKWFNCDSGSELVINGNCESVVGWTATNSILTTANGRIQIANSGTNFGSASQIIPVNIGETYKIKLIISAGTSNQSLDFTNGNTERLYASVSSTGYIYEFEFVANSNSITLSFINSSNTNGFTSFLEYLSCYKKLITITTEITESRNYMNHIIHADVDGGVLYVEELPKIEYFNKISTIGINTNRKYIDFTNKKFLNIEYKNELDYEIEVIVTTLIGSGTAAGTVVYVDGISVASNSNRDATFAHQLPINFKVPVGSNYTLISTVGTIVTWVEFIVKGDE